jgi:hypothetical protein
MIANPERISGMRMVVSDFADKTIDLINQSDWRRPRPREEAGLLLPKISQQADLAQQARPGIEAPNREFPRLPILSFA